MNVMTEGADILSRAQRLAGRFAETAGDHDRTGAPPAANFQDLSEAGLLALTVDARFGGLGRGLRDAAAVVGTVARGEPSTALILAMHYIQHAAIARRRHWPAALAEQVARDALSGPALISGVQSEPGVGSPSRGGLPQTVARRIGGEWRLSGHKNYVTGAPLLGWLNVSATTDEATPRVGNFLVPGNAPGLRIVKNWNQLGMRASCSEDVLFEDLAVPFDHAIDLRPIDAPPELDPQGRGWWFGLLSAVYDGVARSARDWTADFLHRRAPPNLGRPLATVPRLQEALGAIEVRLIASAGLLRDLAEATDTGGPVSLASAGAVKQTVCQNALDVTLATLALCGNHGLSRDNPLERHHRNALYGRMHAPQEDTIFGAAGRAALEAGI